MKNIFDINNKIEEYTVVDLRKTAQKLKIKNYTRLRKENLYKRIYGLYEQEEKTTYKNIYEEFPPEIIGKIAEYLPIKEAYSLMKLSKRIYEYWNPTERFIADYLKVSSNELSYVLNSLILISKSSNLDYMNFLSHISDKMGKNNIKKDVKILSKLASNITSIYSLHSEKQNNRSYTKFKENIITLIPEKIILMLRVYGPVLPILEQYT